MPLVPGHTDRTGWIWDVNKVCVNPKPDHAEALLL